MRNSLGANCLAALFLSDHPVLDAHRAALDAVAGASFGVTEISHPGLLFSQDAPLLRRHAEEIGLAIRAVHAPPMRRDSTLARQRETAALAAALGAAILIVHVSSLRFASPDPVIRARARERDLRQLEALAAFCTPLGLTLGLENGKHPRHADYLLSLLQTLEGSPSLDEAVPSCPSITSSPHHPPAPRAGASSSRRGPPAGGGAQRGAGPRAFAPRRGVPASAGPVPGVASSSPAGLVFDSGHAALRGGDPVRVARTMLPRLLHTHLHDNHGTHDEHLPPGEGRIDWRALLDLLEEAGYTGARLIELRPRWGWGPEQWQRDLERGRKLLSGK